MSAVNATLEMFMRCSLCALLVGLAASKLGYATASLYTDIFSCVFTLLYLTLHNRAMMLLLLLLLVALTAAMMHQT
jgi:hypothetical protein